MMEGLLDELDESQTRKPYLGILLPHTPDAVRRTSTNRIVDRVHHVGPALDRRASHHHGKWGPHLTSVDFLLNPDYFQLR